MRIGGLGTMISAIALGKLIKSLVLGILGLFF